jgi:hypothetical protein
MNTVNFVGWHVSYKYYLLVYIPKLVLWPLKILFEFNDICCKTPRGLSLRANCTDRATAACQQS